MFLFNITVLVLLFNHSLVTFMLSGTPMIAWKQILAFVFAILIVRKYCHKKISRIKYTYIFIFLFLFSLSGVYIIDDITRARGYISVLIGMVYFIYFSLFFTIESKSELRFTYYFLLTICLFISIGIIIDYFTLIFKFMNKLQSSRDVIDQDKYRPCFTIGSPTLLFAVLSLPLLIHFSKKIKFRFNKIFISICILIFCFTLFISGSRLPTILFVVFTVYAILYNETISLYYKLAVLFALSILTFYLFSYHGLNRFAIIFSMSDAGNYRRLHLLSEWYNNDLHNNLFGLGGGYLTSDSNIFDTGHFESSFLSKYTEYGFVGVISFFYVYFILLFIKSREPLHRLWVMFMLFQSMFSPTLSSLLFITILGLSFPLALSNRNEYQVFNHYSNI